MARIEQLINEIFEMKGDVSHKCALRIYNLLENNKKLFGEKMEADNLALLLKNFEAISYGNPTEYNSSGYQRDFEKNYESLSFYLNKII